MLSITEKNVGPYCPKGSFDIGDMAAGLFGSCVPLRPATMAGETNLQTNQAMSAADIAPTVDIDKRLVILI